MKSTMSESEVLCAVESSPNMSEAAKLLGMDRYEFEKLAKSYGLWRPATRSKKTHWFDDEIPEWKVNSARHYYAQGLDVHVISHRTGIPKALVEELVMDEGVVYSTALGQKSEPYYDDEMMYSHMGPCPLPSLTVISDN